MKISKISQGVVQYVCNLKFRLCFIEKRYQNKCFLNFASQIGTILPPDIIFPMLLQQKAKNKLYWILHLGIMYQKNGRLTANSNYEQKLVTHIQLYNTHTVIQLYSYTIIIKKYEHRRGSEQVSLKCATMACKLF